MNKQEEIEYRKEIIRSMSLVLKRLSNIYKQMQVEILNIKDVDMMIRELNKAITVFTILLSKLAILKASILVKSKVPTKT